MTQRFFEVAFTPRVQAEQTLHGSRRGYERLHRQGVESEADRLGPAEAEFISARDSFYLATVSETGWPHVQHRGGPAGFVHVSNDQTLLWADYRGNKQYVSIGNAATNNRVALIFVDYPGRTRLKVLGRMGVVELADHSDLAASLVVPDYNARLEHAIRVEIEAFDWNCPQHITPRFTLEDVEAMASPLRTQIKELQDQLGSCRSHRRGDNPSEQ